MLNLRDESFDDTLFDGTEIKSLEYCSLNFFIESCDDSDPYKYKEYSESALEPASFARDTTESRDDSSSSDSDDHEHKRKSECIDESIDDSCYQ